MGLNNKLVQYNHNANLSDERNNKRINITMNYIQKDDTCIHLMN